jgi:hypothetical protein
MFNFINPCQDAILGGELHLDEATTEVAEALLLKVQLGHRTGSSNFTIDSGITLRCDGTNPSQTKKDVTVTFLAFPFLSTSRPQALAPKTLLGASAEIGLLNYLHGINRNPEQELNQTFCKLSPDRDIVAVSQIWALILNGG